MRWHEVTVFTTEEVIEAVSNILHELGAGGVSIEESGTLNKERDTTFGQYYEQPLNDIPEGYADIKGYFNEETDITSIMDALHKFMDGLAECGLNAGAVSLRHQLVDDEDWADAWKQYFKPLQVSNRLTIKPTWEAYEPKSENELILELDPGMAFGTGTHATTALCLRALEHVLQPGDDVIDVGTGSGVLAIAASKLGARHVLAVDLDPVAVKIAKENIAINHLESSITVKLSDLLQVLNVSKLDQANELGVQLPVRLVVANILAEIIVQFVQDVYDVLTEGGKYVTSGIIKSKQAMVEQALVAVGFAIEEISEEQDWVAIIAVKK